MCDIFIRESACPTAQAGDILPVPDYFWKAFSIPLISQYILNLNANSSLKILKSQNPAPKSTEKMFSVDFKSTIKFLKTSQTRYQLISISKNPKNINIDQL